MKSERPSTEKINDLTLHGRLSSRLEMSKASPPSSLFKIIFLLGPINVYLIYNNTYSEMEKKNVQVLCIIRLKLKINVFILTNKNREEPEKRYSDTRKKKQNK